MRLICAILLFSVHRCYSDYVAAVVEYNSLPGPTANLTIEENLEHYIYQIEQAKQFGAKIIVFPEYGLTGLVDNPESYALPVPNVGTTDFSNDTYLLYSLSNAAIANELYIVVNLLERVNVAEDNSTIYYNTNVVFASNGTLVARYRKINLFQEPNLTPGSEIVTFTTDFGTFALITCMDILYYNPSQTVLLNTGVTDVIYPAAWNSYIPFYMSLEVQVGYATANKVNLLASNINDPSNGRGGSSIISSDGTVLRTILTDRPATNIVYANVIPPTTTTRSFTLLAFDILRNDTVQVLSDYKNQTDFQYDRYVYKPLDLTTENITEEICDGSFCCNFNILAFQNETNSSETYKLVAFNGRTQFDNKDVGIKFCNLIACLNEDIASCGVRPSFPYSTTFRQVTVWGNWEVEPETFYRPASLSGNLEPIYNATYLESSTNETVGISYNITGRVNNVVLFGLYVRSSVQSFSISLGLVAILVAIQGLF